jgi:hypothetical protein
MNIHSYCNNSLLKIGNLRARRIRSRSLMLQESAGAVGGNNSDPLLAAAPANAVVDETKVKECLKQVMCYMHLKHCKYTFEGIVTKTYFLITFP